MHCSLCTAQFDQYYCQSLSTVFCAGWSITVHCALLTVHCLVINQLLTAINAFSDFLLHQSALNPVPFHCIPNSVIVLMVSPLVVIHVDSHTILQVLDLLPNHRLKMYKTPPKFPIQTHQLCTPMSLYALQMQKASYSRPFILQKHSAWAKTIAEQIAAKCFLLVLQEYFSHFGNKFLR